MPQSKLDRARVLENRLHRTIRKTYAIELLKEIPNILQIITFTSFLALIFHSLFTTIVLTIAITVLSLFLLEYYFLSKDELRLKYIVSECVKDGYGYDKKHSNAKKTAIVIERKIFIYNQIVSFLFGILTCLIALRISQLSIG